MTPNELLSSTVAMFEALLVTPDQQAPMLEAAMRAYQTKAGVRKKIMVNAYEIDTPKAFACIASASDAEGDAVFPEAELEDGKIAIESDAQLPVTLYYFVDLCALNKESDHLPQTSISLIQRHLFTQLERENDKRIAQMQGMMDAELGEVTSAESKDMRLQQIEEQMTAEGAFAQQLSIH